MNFKKLFNSLKYAICGIKTALKEEQTFRLELLIAVLVIAISFYLNLQMIEKAIIFITIFLVLSLELVNSLIERISDMVCSSLDKRIKKIKDIGGGIVLFSCFMAAVIGIIIFLPYLLKVL